MEHDGWRVYYQFVKALHQSCVSHIVRRCRDLAEIVSATAAALPLAVLGLLEKALALRDRYQAGAISLHGQWTAAGRIEAQLDRLLDKPYQTAIRLAVMARHLCGGSRTWNGARIQQNLTSVLQTCH